MTSKHPQPEPIGPPDEHKPTNPAPSPDAPAPTDGHNTDSHTETAAPSDSESPNPETPSEQAAEPATEHPDDGNHTDTATADPIAATGSAAKSKKKKAAKKQRKSTPKASFGKTKQTENTEGIPLGSAKGVETMFRNAFRAELELIALAATKANIMISLNGFIVSALMISGAFIFALFARFSDTGRYFPVYRRRIHRIRPDFRLARACRFAQSHMGMAARRMPPKSQAA